MTWTMATTTSGRFLVGGKPASERDIAAIIEAAVASRMAGQMEGVVSATGGKVVAMVDGAAEALQRLGQAVGRSGGSMRGTPVVHDMTGKLDHGKSILAQTKDM